MYYDSHIHSLNSPDGSSSVMAICARAIAIGLSGIALTDHVEIEFGARIAREVVENLKADIKRARNIYGERLEISLGIELGEAHHNLRLARDLTSDPEIDFVIGSLHKPRNWEDYYFVDYDVTDPDEMLSTYCDELMEMAVGECYDVIGHIFFQLRYMSAKTRARYNLSPYLGRIREILRVAARAGKGIEINTSGLWRNVGITLPPMEVVKIFREEGGEILTTGSDAHRLERVGLSIDGGVKCIAAAGFDKFAFYKKRIPCFHCI